ncbi:hypothetical protein QKV95_gp078 [Poseidoniales virus YSH_150918]|uniref:Uncharacterized protein n=1 Tax=Poseidoniales virus YSH_150918 TaxID=3071324 RepID=A0A976UBN2_9CAUD|nr:hypothetical protein QKV95_gp078 [Yangshan Harbor Poseidoniales virus]UVF62555.1 hypothetical protein [Poseidoniales virus YSH_150918]
MAEDSVSKLAGSLADLNNVTAVSSYEFKGFAKRITEIANNTSKASKRWTIFSRLVSGTPIWALQNKLRAYVEIIGGFAENSRKVSEAQMEQNKVMKESVLNYEKLEKQTSSLTKVSRLNQELLNGQISGRKFLSNLHKKENKEVLEAAKNTNAYSNAILLGKTRTEAYQEALGELNENLKNQRKQFRDLKREVQKADALQSFIGGSGSFQDVQKFLEKEKGDAKAKRKEQGGIGATFRQTPQNLKKMQEGFMKRMRNIRLGIALLNVKLAKLSTFIKPIMNYLFKFLIVGFLGMMGLLAFFIVVRKVFSKLEERFGVVEQIKEIFNIVFSIIGEFFGIVGAFIGGDYQGMIDYAMSIASSLLDLAIKAGGLLLTFTLGSLLAFGYMLPDLITSGIGFLMDNFTTFIKYFVGGILLKIIATQLLQMVAIYAIPIAIGLIVVGALAKLIKSFSPFGKRATGGTVGANEGMTLVGENGPELVSLPSGSKVHTNAQSRRMGGGNTINITINARDTSDAELRRIADKIGNMVNSKINRSVSSRTLG